MQNQSKKEVYFYACVEILPRYLWRKAQTTSAERSHLNREAKMSQQLSQTKEQETTYIPCLHRIGDNIKKHKLISLEKKTEVCYLRKLSFQNNLQKSK